MEDFRQEKLKASHAIFKAIIDDDIETVKHILELYKNTVLTSKEHWSPLHVAVILSKYATVQLLISNGADPLSRDIEGKSPLHWAAHSNVPFPIFEVIASVGNNAIDIADNFGRIPLHYVCLNHSTYPKAMPMETDMYELIHKLSFLLQRTVNIDVPDFEGNTPLLLLSSSIHNVVFTDVVDRYLIPSDVGLCQCKSKSLCGFTMEMLINNGASVQSRNAHGMTPLHFACQKHCVEMTRLLLSKDTRDKPPIDGSGNSPITLCFISTAIQCVSLPYELDAVQDFELMLADKKVRFQDTLRPVIRRWKNHANIQQIGSGFAALHYAIMDMDCSINVVKGLVDYGNADVNIMNHLGKTPLHYGIRSVLMVPSAIADKMKDNWKSKISYLIEKGADVNAQDHGGNTPLHDACEAGDVEFIRLLLDNNANTSLRNSCGATPLLVLQPGEVQRHPALHDPDTMRLAIDLLLEKGSDLNCQDKFGSTALHYAIYHNAKEIVSNLIDSGANKDITDANGESAVQYCKRLERTAIMQILLGEEQTNEVEMLDYFMTPIEVSKAPDWITSMSAKECLPDSKIRTLLLASQTSRLSNSPLENVVLKQLLDFMKAVLDEVERIDHRFKATLELAGSSREGTKVKAPDEFDLLCFLDKFHALCEIEEADNNFVYCRIKSDESHEYENLCDTNNYLSAYKLTSTLYFCIRKAMSNPGVWRLAEGFTLESTADDFKSEEDISGIQCLHFKYCDVLYKKLTISCDIVPAIRVKNWWPSFARQSGGLITDEVKANGCMVIVKPQKEFTLSEEHVRVLSKFAVSVYLSECSVLLSAPESVRQAYKLAKLLLKEKNLYPPLTEEKLSDGEICTKKVVFFV